MENSKKKTKKSVNDEIKNPKNVSSSIDVEDKIKEAHKIFDTEGRKLLEEYINQQKQLVEKQIRNETADIRDYEVLDRKNEDYEITFMVVSSRIKFQPIWTQIFHVTGDFNEFDLTKQYREALNTFLQSEEYAKMQQKLYYKFRMMGVKPIDIYPQIEPQWSTMTRDEKDTRRSNYRMDFKRRKAKQKGNKNG